MGFSWRDNKMRFMVVIPTQSEANMMERGVNLLATRILASSRRFHDKLMILKKKKFWTKIAFHVHHHKHRSGNFLMQFANWLIYVLFACERRSVSVRVHVCIVSRSCDQRWSQIFVDFTLAHFYFHFNEQPACMSSQIKCHTTMFMFH